MANKAEVLMSLKDEISSKLNHIKGEFRSIGVVGKGAMMAVSAGISLAKYGLTQFGNAIKWAYGKVIDLTKAISIGLIGAFAMGVKGSMQQEAAEFRLAAALKISGSYVEKQFEGYKKYASELQAVTTYEDDAILVLMQKMHVMGVSADKLEEATKMAIGLAAATDMDTSATSKFIAMAMSGDASMLARYIPALRSTKDKTQQLALMTEFCSKGFELAQAEALTTRGAFIQMKNSVGDALEAFATPFLGGFTKTAASIKEWCDNNSIRIAEWGKATKEAFETWSSYAIRTIQLVKNDVDAFFGSTDTWQTKMDVLTASATDIFIALAKSTYRAGVNAGELLWQGITDGFANSYAANKVAIEDTYNKTTPKSERSWWGMEKMYWGGEKAMTPEQRKVYWESKNTIYNGFEDNEYDIAGKSKNTVQPFVDAGKRIKQRVTESGGGSVGENFEENYNLFFKMLNEDKNSRRKNAEPVPVKVELEITADAQASVILNAMGIKLKRGQDAQTVLKRVVDSGFYQ